MKIILVKVSKLPESYTGDILLPMDALPNIEDGQVMVCDISTSEKAVRTAKQNRSVWLYGTKVANKLNDGGITKQVYFEKKSVDCEWTPDSVVEDIWREIQFAMYNHRNTSKLNTEQVSKVYEQVARILAENFNVDQEFPSLDTLMSQMLGRR
jgi:hypothetical protein